MPCDSSYLNASGREIELSRVACLLDELDGKPINASYWDGYHPLVYGKCGEINEDKLVSKLCSRLQNIDVKKQSLEMQIWWRDHQIADKKRLKNELKEKKNKISRAAAIAKLTKYERKLLHLEND